MNRALSVIIVNWNAKKVLGALLESLAAHRDGLDLEIIVVDNNSSDGSVEFLKNDFPEVLLLENRENVGFGRANNQAAARASRDTLLLLNPDTQVCPGSLRSMIDFLDRHPGVGAVGPMISNPDGTLQRECARKFPSPFTELLATLRSVPFLRGIDRLRGNLYEVSAAVPCLSGACIMLPKKIFLEIGGFDERFFMYGEDIDLCFRLGRRGYALWYLAQSRIMHIGAVSTRQSLRLESCRSMEMFFLKNTGRHDAFFYRMIIIFTSVLLIGANAIFFLFSRGAKRRHWKTVLMDNLAILRWACGAGKR